MKRLTTFACLAVALTFAVGAFAVERDITSQPVMYFSETAAKAAGDTVDLMGPGGLYPYRGDFETATARPGGQGFLTDGWTTVDVTAPVNNWNVNNYDPDSLMGGDLFAWCGSMAYASCGVGDGEGGYGPNWYDIFEFRKTVGGAASVKVEAFIAFDTEDGWDKLFLQRRTADFPNFEPPTLATTWTGIGTANVDHTFVYGAPDLVDGTDISVAFIFDSDGNTDDGDCFNPTDGAVRIDDITVTVTVGANVDVYTETFEDNDLGPHWQATPNNGVGNFGRVWNLLGDADDCASNFSKLIAFIDDGLVVPGTGGTIGGPGNDYGPPGGYIVNNTGGLLGPTSHIECDLYSPVMTWPDPAKAGMSLAFDVYRHELLIPNDTPGIFYVWGVRSTSGGNINGASYRNRNLVYYGGPNYLRTTEIVDDLIVANPTQVQVSIGVIEYGWVFDYGDGTNGTPAPYFDNIRVKVYPTGGARIVVSELALPNDGFPAIGDIDLNNLGANSIRFDMCRNISAATHSRNDPGDTIVITVTPRAGGALTGPPVMHWTFAVQNTLFNPYRTLPANPVVGLVTRNANGVIIANSYNFDLPDTGMIFPGDLLHYYFAATDNVGGNIVTATNPGPVSVAQFGNPEPMRYPSVFTMSGLPSVKDELGTQPTLLFWNDFGFRGSEDEWYGAFRHLGLVRGTDYDVFDTHAPSSGLSNGLGGRASLAQIDGYTDMVFSSGDLSSPTLSDGTGNDRGADTPLLNEWFNLGGRDLFMTGDDLGQSLYTTGTINRTFLETKIGWTYGDTDVRDNIANQTAPLVVRMPVGPLTNPVFLSASNWVAYGGCFGINDFDNVTPLGSAIRLAQFTAPGGVTTPYPYAAATLNQFGAGNRIVALNHDLYFITDPAKAPAPAPARVVVLSDVLNYFGVNNDLGNIVGTDLPVAKFGVESYPNPFNPQLTLKYTLKNPGNVVMKVYNVRGELVKTLLNGYVETPAPIVWDGTNEQGGSVSSGVYFVETRAGGEVNVQKATMVK